MRKQKQAGAAEANCSMPNRTTQRTHASPGGYKENPLLHVQRVWRMQSLDVRSISGGIHQARTQPC